jgi:two-component system, NtrC family, sensor histidine kinase HydH
VQPGHLGSVAELNIADHNERLGWPPSEGRTSNRDQGAAMWKKVTAPITLVGLLWIASSGATTYYIAWLEESHARSVAEDVTTIESASALEGTVWSLHSHVAAHAANDPAGVQQDVAEYTANFERCLEQADATSFTAAEKASVAEISRRYVQYCRHLSGRLERSAAGTLDGALADANLLNLAQGIEDECRNLSRINEQHLADSANQRARLAKYVNLGRLAVMIGGPTIGLLLGFWIARGLHRSVSQISVTLSDAAGELEHDVGHVVLHPSGELPALQEQVQTVAGRIRQVVDELQQARQQVMAAERLAAVGELAAGVAHEIRNPLTSVKLLIQMAARRSSDRPFTEKQFHVLQEEIGRMEGTIQGLLDFARPAQLNRVRHDVCDTVRRALSLVEGRAKQQGVLTCEAYPAEPTMIEGDPEQLHQVFVNLFINGIEAMERGGELHVKVAADAASPPSCRVTVGDSGPGIAPLVLQRLFEPFVTTKEHGTGLGLAISRRIIQEHRGTLQAANRQGGGAVFTITLPRSTMSDVIGTATGNRPGAGSANSRPAILDQSNPADGGKDRNAQAADH